MSVATSTAIAIAAGVGAAGSIGSALIGSHAAGQAADQQTAAEQKVLDLIGQGVPDANKNLTDYYGKNMALLQPYLSTGTNALDQLNKLTSGGGFKAPTSVTEQNDPGYHFRMQQGQQALEQSAAAHGGALGGGELKALNQYGQDYASNEYGNVYNRALGTYQTNFGNLQNLAGLGLNATNTGVSAGNLTGTGLSSNILQGLGLSTQALTGIGNAQAAGTVGSANAWQSGLGGVAGAASGAASNLSQLSLLNAILNRPASTGPVNI